MITLYRPANYNNPRASEFTGRSIDTKPNDVENGAIYKEIDTGRVYRYDKENNRWIEWEGTPVAPSITVEPITITENGITTAPEGKAYSPITVDVSASGATSGTPGDITFYDYDGNIVTSWSLEELATKTALPDYPSHDGLVCQGWNWSLEDLKSTNRKMNVGAMYITDDGKTRIYIRLHEGRTSPMLGCCPNGTVTVDWGDGTTPDTLTGTSTTTVKWTPNHAYAAPGDYVIKLTVDGEMRFSGETGTNLGSRALVFSSVADGRNTVYQNSVQKIEIGFGIGVIGFAAFQNCYSLASVTIPNGVTSIERYAFQNCYSLAWATIPNSVTNIESHAFSKCYSLCSVTISSGMTSISNMTFESCYSLAWATISNSVTSIGNSVFDDCYSLAWATIPNSVTNIGSYTFADCRGAAFFDFTAATTVPTLSGYAFNNIPADCEIRVPASLVDEWKAATNWSTYADHIVGV